MTIPIKMRARMTTSTTRYNVKYRYNINFIKKALLNIFKLKTIFYNIFKFYLQCFRSFHFRKCLTQLNLKPNEITIYNTKTKSKK